jgi:hypothetical protein
LPVFSLNEVFLNEGEINAEVQQPSGDFTEGFVFTRTLGKAKDPLVLSSQGDEVLHRRRVEPLDVPSEKLSTL